MNPGILTSGYRSPPLPYGLLGNPTPAPMPGNYLHPETQDWASRVRNAGGSVSGTTLRAVDGFVQAIYNYGLRSLFYRLNLFCGDSSPSLVAVRTPLFRGPSLTGAPFGNALDTNFNFVQGDYSETGGNGGLVGNGVNKRLDTGLAPDAMPTVATGHLAYWTQGAPFLGDITFVGANNSGATERYTTELRTGGRFVTWGSSVAAFQSSGRDDGPGFFLHTRTSQTFLRLYRNGVAAGAITSTTTTPGAHSIPLAVFCGNSNGSPGSFGAGARHRLRCYSTGDGMSPQQISDYYAALNSFMIAMGRV